jgi:hypothetical protein
LTLTDLHELSASLDESFILSENGFVLIEAPLGLRGVLLDHLLVVRANGLPLLTAVNRLLEISHALLNLVSEHVLDVDLLSASVNDLVRNLDQKGFHPLISRVVRR